LSNSKNLPNNKETIEDLRRQLEEAQKTIQVYEQKIEYLRDIQQEYMTIRSRLGSSPQAFAQIMHPQNQVEEYNQMRKQQNAALDRELERERQATEEFERLSKEILAENPAWKKNATERISGIKDKYSKLKDTVNRFYDMSNQELQTYIYNKHDVKKSAVQSLITEKIVINELGQRLFGGYICSYCTELEPTLKDFEYHAHWDQSHRSANLSRVEKEMSDAIRKVRNELDADIRSAIQSKKSRQYKQRIAEQSRERIKAVEGLPYVE
jgi:flagellar biosynthesis chaperone FliJ